MKIKSAGFTLIELVVAVLIAAILGRIGFDMFKRYIVRANRSVAKTTLMSLAAKQETQALQNPTSAYATNFFALNSLGSTSNVITTFYIDQSGAASTTSSGSSIYQISFAASPTPSATAYAFQAVAQGVQATRDAACKTLILNSTGLKQAQNSSGTAVDVSSCWDK